jgi:hypothetical protein
MPRLRASAPSRHDLAQASEPAVGLPLLPRSANNGATIAAVAVADPYDPDLRIRALARLDLLDRELRAGRLDEAAYLAGRDVEKMFSGLGRVGGGGQWLEGDRVDGATAGALAVELGAERAVAVNKFLGWLLRCVGVADTRLLWLVLGCGYPLAAAAASFGRGGQRGLYYTADRFRDALGVLADAKAARGRGLR